VKPPRSELAYATLLTYCPRGNTDAIRDAKNFVLMLKENRAGRATGETASARVARRLRERDDVAEVVEFLDPASEDRPKARTHLESLSLADPLALPAKITLIDDVVTRGAQLFGAAWKIWSVRPDIDVRAFAVVRTISEPADFSALAAPRIGRIEWRDEECFRRP